MSGTRVREHLGYMADVEVELKMIDGFLRTASYGVANRLGTEVVTRISGNDGVRIRVCQGTIS